jgi:hypothetical protein
VENFLMSLFDPSHIAVVTPVSKPDTLKTTTPNLTELTSLNPLQGRVSAIHASSLFHLFQKTQQLHVARALAGLLSPDPGSLIFGQHVGQSNTGIRISSNVGKDNGEGWKMFCHNPKSWTELWDGEVFEKGAVKVECALDFSASLTTHVLTWSVTRM